MTLSNQNSSKKVVKDAPVWLSVSIAILLILGGIGLGYYTFSQNQNAKILTAKGVKILGTVSFVDRTKTNQNERMNHYTISYNYDNVSYTYKTSLKFIYYNINEKLTLLVNPDKPSMAMLSSDDDMNKGSYLWAIFLVFSGVGILYFKPKATINSKIINK